MVAVLRELRKSEPGAEIRFWCDRKFAPQARSIMGHLDDSIPVHTVLAGKLRRYHHLSVMRQLLWPSLVASNLRDSFLVLFGIVQSFVKLVIWRPDTIFLKGGYVCLPVGIAAHLLRIPTAIHDSDAHPGLTNRILSRWAMAIATGSPLKYYSYPAERSRYVGIPISDEFRAFSTSEKLAAKSEWGVSKGKPLIVITGGGLGAKRINDAIVMNLKDLQKLGSVILISGNLQYDELRAITPPNSNKFQLHAFVSDGMSRLLGAADVVITRAGATTILELAALKAPTILIPNGKLTGGHQLKNASVYSENGAVIVVDEDEMGTNPSVLINAVSSVLSDNKLADKMGRALSEFARPNAARDVADMVLGLVNRKDS